MTYLAKGLNLELKENKIDVLSFNPGVVATKMSLLDDEHAGKIAITTKRAVSVCLRDLGYTSLTNGDVRHELYDWLYDSVMPF